MKYAFDVFTYLQFQNKSAFDPQQRFSDACVSCQGFRGAL